jgi:hypothetical protein
MGWILPLTYFIFQIPFMLYYAVLGYAYGVETLFAKFYTPQLFGIALIGTGMRFVDALLGIVLNTVVLLIVYVIVVYLTQRKWLKERIRG